MSNKIMDSRFKAKARITKLIFNLSLTLSILLPFSAATQAYQPMLNASANWNYSHTTMCLPFTPEQFEYSIYLYGDTLVNGNTYQKAVRPHREWVLGDGAECTESSLLQTGYIGALREDAAERKVYFIPPGEEEVLLYDFALETGDTLGGYLFQNWEVPPVVVDSVDQINIDGSFHKRLIIDAPSELFLIEGVGSTFGLVDGHPFGLPDAPVTQLTCWTNMGAYYPESVESCAVITDVGDFAAESSIPSAFPNPAQDHLGLLLPENTVGKDVGIELININAQLVFSQRSIYQSNNITIEIGHLPSGSYVLRVDVAGYNFQYQNILKL